MSCCICGKASKSIAPGGRVYCGERGKCEARVFVIHATDAEALWGAAHIKVSNARYVRARTRRGGRTALHMVRKAKPDTILQIKGREWRKVS